MKDKILFSITQVTDDSTGIWQVGELDFSIHVGALDDYLKSNPINARDRLFAAMGNMCCHIDRYAREHLEKEQSKSEVKIGK